MARRSAGDGHTVTTSAAVDLTAGNKGGKGLFSKFRRSKDDDSAVSGRSGGSSAPTIEIKVPSHRMMKDDPGNVTKSASRALHNLSLSEPPPDHFHYPQHPEYARQHSDPYRRQPSRSRYSQRNSSISPSRRRHRRDDGSVVSTGSAPVRGKMGNRRRPGDDEGSAVSGASTASAPTISSRSTNRKRITLERLKQSSEQINRAYDSRPQQQRPAEHRRDSNGNSAQHSRPKRNGGGSSSNNPIHIDNLPQMETELRKPRQTGSGRRNEGSVYTAPTILPQQTGGSSVRSAPTVVQNPNEDDVNSRCHLSYVEKPRPRARASGNATTATPDSSGSYPRLASVPEAQQQQQHRHSVSVVNEIRRPSIAASSLQTSHASFDASRDSLGQMSMQSLAASSDPNVFDSSRRSSMSSSATPDMFYNSSGMSQPMMDAESFRRHMARGMQAPEGDVTVVFTDLQGSTTLWETHPPAMKAAVDLHDKIIRRCYGEHSGYEITTEGDAFQLAFQHPIDALAFALKTQIELHKAEWSPDILALEEASEKDGFRGFRVRMGIHHGPTKTRVHDVTGRTFYEGEAIEIAKAMEGMCHGGQILTTVETWRAVSGISERVLGSPQVMDCGEHELEIKRNDGKGYLSKRVVQLVPKELAFDYFAARGREERPGSDEVRLKKETDVVGRKFAPLKTKKQLSTSFVDAPYAGGKVTIVFIYTKGINDQPADLKAKNLKILSKGVRSLLMQSNPPGYECQEENGSWMIAFGRIANAVSFGLRLVEAIDRAPLKGDVDRRKMFKIGIHTGPFTSMGPHTVTGRADYFGPVVNRAARVASQCELGQVLIGMPLPGGEMACAPDFGSKIITCMVGIRKLKGLTVDMALFSCARAPR